MIPPLEGGILPDGVWPCTFGELTDRFGVTEQRLHLLGNLRAFLDQTAKLPPVPIFIDGSFVTDKPMPNDIDICADLTALPAKARPIWENLFFQERWYLKKKGIDFWVRSPDSPEDITQTEFTRLRREDADRLELPTDTRKGFLCLT